MTDFDKASKDFKRFWEKLHYHYPDLEFIRIIEPQHTGSWHIHALLKSNNYENLSISHEQIEKLWGHVRLDRQLERLFAAIKESVGLDNALVFLVSTGYFDEAAEDEPRYRIPSGTFSTKRAVSLLNSYLSAKHGNDQYVDGSYRDMIYLDHSTIERHGLDLADVRRDARDFLVMMSGVADVKSLTDIVGETTPELRRIGRGLDPKTAGDLRLEFAPGWTVNDDVRLPVVTWQVREGNPATPAFILGPGVPVKIEDGEVNASAIAPTVSSVMRIRSPNGAADKPLIL